MSENVKILCVDDERNVLRALERIFLDDDYEILIANSGEEGLETLRENPGVQVVISDYRMPGMNGVDFLRQVCNQCPETIRIVLSGYADTAAVVAAINEGQIYKFIPKPWNDDELRQTIGTAIEAFNLHRRNRELTEQLEHSNEELRVLNEHLEQSILARTAELALQNRALEHARNVLYQLPVGVLAILADGIIAQCNERAAEVLAGVCTGDIITEKAEKALPSDLVTVYRSIVESKQVVCMPLRVGDHDVLVRGSMMKEVGQEAVILVLTELYIADKEVGHV